MAGAILVVRRYAQRRSRSCDRANADKAEEKHLTMLKIAPHQLFLALLFTMAMSFIVLAASFAEAPPLSTDNETADVQID